MSCLNQGYVWCGVLDWEKFVDDINYDIDTLNPKYLGKEHIEGFSYFDVVIRNFPSPTPTKELSYGDLSDSFEGSKVL